MSRKPLKISTFRNGRQMGDSKFLPVGKKEEAGVASGLVQN
jgi:hypothetical protein